MLSSLLLTAVLAAAYVHPEQLVETDWVAAHAGDANVRIVDMRRSGYEAGHLPEAVFLAPEAIREANSAPTFLPTPAAFKARIKISHGRCCRITEAHPKFKTARSRLSRAV